MLVYLEPGWWNDLAAFKGELPASLRSPLIIVDPILSGRHEGEAEVETSALDATLEATPGLHLVLATSTAGRADELVARHPTRILIGEVEADAEGRVIDEATEKRRAT